MEIVAIVPARNEVATIGATVAALLPMVARVVVVDDASDDGTTEAATGSGAAVLSLAKQTGKGGAVQAGVRVEPAADVYLLVDADVGASARFADVLLQPVVAGDADMAIGVLPSAGGRGGFGLVRDLARAGIRRATSSPRSVTAKADGFVATAPLSGQRAVQGTLLRAVELAPRFGLETALTIDAVRAGARVVEVPVAMQHRHTGRGPQGFLHRGRQGLDVARALWPRLISTRTG